MEDSFNDLLMKMGEAQVSLDRERKEAVAARNTYNKYLGAAEKVAAKIEAGDAAKETEEALATALEYLETNLVDVEREEAEAVEAEGFFNEIKATVEVLRDRLITAKKSIQTASKEMQKAELRKERASVKAENAASLAGLRDSTNALGDATKAMLAKAEAAKIEAAAMETKASMLGTPKATNTMLDDMLNDAPVNTGSLQDRLAKLKK